MDGCILFSSDYCTTLIKEHGDRLLTKINTFDTSNKALNSDIQHIISTEVDVQQDEDLFISGSRYNEELYQQMCHTSKFKHWCNAIFQEAQKLMNSTESEKNGISNNRYCPKFIEILNKLYLPILPLWTNLLIGDLTRHLNPKHSNYDNKKMGMLLVKSRFKNYIQNYQCY